MLYINPLTSSFFDTETFLGIIPEGSISVTREVYDSKLKKINSGFVFTNTNEENPLEAILNSLVIKVPFEEYKAEVLKLLAAKRFSVETGGITLPNGIKILTDRESQSQINSAYSTLRDGLINETPWKTANGTWVPITINDIKPIATAVAQHVRACFDAERLHTVEIDKMNTVEELQAYDITANWPSN